jgi:tetratricopeptide (TPR) repeat protein
MSGTPPDAGPPSPPAGSLGLARALALLQANRPEDALHELATLPPEDALRALSFELRANALLQLDRWDEAADAARGGLAAGGPDPDLFGLLSAAERRRGDLVTAERAVLDGLALAPSDVDLLTRYASLCIAAGQLDKAGKLVDRALAEDPLAAGVFAVRVELAHARGADREAERISREFIAEYPEHPVAHALLGGTSATRGKVSEAYQGFRQAVAAEPTDADYAEAALETRIARHPLMVPVRPFIRFGAVLPWIVAVGVMFGLRALNLPVAAGIAGLLWFLLCVYSWVVPPLVRRRIRRRWAL